jgi:CheY-like chemotaxis protein
MKNSDSAPPAPGRTDSSQRILVVDDESYVRELLVRILNQSGYENVDSACDGAEAWEALYKTNYRLVITDHKMPRLTGLELIERMRFSGLLQPVILISGTLPTAEINRTPGLQIDAMLAKPFTFAAFMGLVEQFVPATESPVMAEGNQFLGTKEPAIARPQKKSSRRILVVDDDSESRQLKVDLLRSSGYQVEAANDGVAGWEALRTYEYDLVVTDNQMPRMTGLELIKNLEFSHMSIPVIMATGNVPADEFMRRPWLKPEATLQKPFTNNDLLEAIRSVLGE